MYEHETIEVLKTLYQRSFVRADDIDEARYILLKKFSEASRSCNPALAQLGFRPVNLGLGHSQHW